MTTVPGAGLEDRVGRLDRLAAVMAGADVGRADGPLKTGVDLGTAYTVVIATDPDGLPVAGAVEPTEVVRDGVVVAFHGAIAAVRRLKTEVETRLGRRLRHAAAGYPPGVAAGSVRAVANVLEAAGLDCTGLVEEPTAANAVLGLRRGAIVDVGGGTTGIAILEHGCVVRTADEPTGGTHLSLVLAGALGVPLDEAERIKQDPGRAIEVAGIVRPVLEKIATIVDSVVDGAGVESLALVGGTCRLPAVRDVVAEVTGLPVGMPTDPRYVTSLGLALHDEPIGAVDGRR